MRSNYYATATRRYQAMVQRSAERDAGRFACALCRLHGGPLCEDERLHRAIPKKAWLAIGSRLFEAAWRAHTPGGRDVRFTSDRAADAYDRAGDYDFASDTRAFFDSLVHATARRAS